MQHFSNINFSNEIKQILYKCWYRGCKETDILIGTYVRENIKTLTEHEILLLKKLIEESDYDLYNWITGISETPKHYSDLISKMAEFSIQNARKRTKS